jgi:hypothetical protein
MVGETDFWSRYFNSRLWERHRASVRSSKLGTAKADEMFDKYLEAPDDGQLVFLLCSFCPSLRESDVTSLVPALLRSRSQT